MSGIQALFSRYGHVLRIGLSLGTLAAGIEEMCEAFFVSFEGILELYHAVIFVSAIHIIHAVEDFVEAREKVKQEA